MSDKTRIIDVMSLSFTKDKMILEDNLERVINGRESIDDKERNIKNILKDIVLNEEITKKWGEYLAASEEESE